MDWSLKETWSDNTGRSDEQSKGARRKTRGRCIIYLISSSLLMVGPSRFDLWRVIEGRFANVSVKDLFATRNVSTRTENWAVFVSSKIMHYLHVPQTTHLHFAAFNFRPYTLKIIQAAQKKTVLCKGDARSPAYLCIILRSGRKVASRQQF